MSSHISNKKSRSSTSTKADSTLYTRVTQQIEAALSKGVVPWRKPWKGRAYLPCNAISKRPYNGVNLLLLSLAPFANYRWITARQANELGGHIRKGERGSLVVFWKILEREATDSESKRSIPLLRYFHVFNIEQVEGIAFEDTPTAPTINKIEEAEQAVRNMPNPPRLIGHQTSAFYRPGDDTVAMPRIERFDSADHYYATLMHELGHSTGHPSRLNRPGVASTAMFGSEDYSREELVAELASAFLCAEIGLDNSLIDNAASYVNGWLNALNRDTKAIVLASSQARHAADFIMGRHLQE